MTARMAAAAGAGGGGNVDTYMTGLPALGGRHGGN